MNLIKSIFSIFQGQIIAKRIARRYGLDKDWVIDHFLAFREFAAANGVAATLRGFEIMLRKELAEHSPGVAMIEPLYCQGLDPLNPYPGNALNSRPEEPKS